VVIFNRNDRLGMHKVVPAIFGYEIGVGRVHLSEAGPRLTVIRRFATHLRSFVRWVGLNEEDNMPIDAGATGDLPVLIGSSIVVVGVPRVVDHLVRGNRLSIRVPRERPAVILQPNL